MKNSDELRGIAWGKRTGHKLGNDAVLMIMKARYLLAAYGEDGRLHDELWLDRLMFGVVGANAHM